MTQQRKNPQATSRGGYVTVAIASVSGETCGAVAGELEAVGGAARRVDVAAVSAGGVVASCSSSGRLLTIPGVMATKNGEEPISYTQTPFWAAFVFLVGERREEMKRDFLSILRASEWSHNEA
ncbi:hypothetical protein EYF80_057316 [Liparis tanakae]|uniref:Uncharacterized protein n=1 Tax=Liparis tanakae TaxID=230148 RepID=A0A4Z2EWB2_9TELE|nr:hypothetical protein EYF80_057316 [Liparis tanakae]